jgi:UDP-N-acetylmuramyl pentapeptide phosphotransferase/UDP-N-acetylglucosamine-1-phosphate transferase
MASSLQFLGSAVVVVALIALAVGLGRVRINPHPTSKEPPTVPLVGGTAFILSSAFMSLAILHDAIPASLNVAGMIGLIAAGSALIWNWSNRAGWSEQHRLAVAGGLLLTYVWYGFVQIPSAGEVSPLLDTVGNVIFAGGALTLLVIAWKRVSVSKSLDGKETFS